MGGSCDEYFLNYSIFEQMSVGYKFIDWNPQKKLYDKILWAGILLSLLSCIGFQFMLHPNNTIETALIRALATTAFIMLNVILCIGPLCRLDARFLPLLYNRRHMGVSMFIIALAHGLFSMIQFHALGDVNPIVSVFTSNENYDSISRFPFQVLGFLALIILFFMAVTSHDYWLKKLSPRIWKSLHMLVYVAYGLLVVHIIAGTLQYERHALYWVLLIASVAVVSGLHIMSAIKEFRNLRQAQDLENDGYYKACRLVELDENCGKPVFIDNVNIALFNYQNEVHAVNNICKHQMGPIGEGKIVDGCITCPWHGYQYYPGNGKSPPPFEEKLDTYATRVIGEYVYVNPNARRPEDELSVN